MANHCFRSAPFGGVSTRVASVLPESESTKVKVSCVLGTEDHFEPSDCIGQKPSWNLHPPCENTARLGGVKLQRGGVCGGLSRI